MRLQNKGGRKLSFENMNIRKILNKALEEDAIIIDVRCKERFLCGHIPLAINLPVSQIEEGNVNLPKNKTLIVYCDSGGISTKAARLLGNMGYRIINSVGGLNAYKGSLTK